MIARRTLLAMTPVCLLASAVKSARAANLHWDSGYLFLRVRVNGRPADALLDLNVGTTIIDRRHAAALGVAGKGGRPVIDAAGQRLGPLDITLSDLTDYANFNLRGRIALILGRDLFAAAPLSLDLATLSLSPVPRTVAQRGRALPVTNRFGVATIPIAIDSVPCTATLLFRDLDAIIVNAAFAGRAGLGRDRGSGARSVGAPALRSGTSIRRLDVAGRSFTNLNAALNASATAPDAWLGPAILARFRIVIDVPGGTMWFDPA